MDGNIIISTSYGGKELMAIDPTGSGDVTETHIVWRQKDGHTMMPSAVHVDGLIYTVTDKGIAHAIRAEDGELVWRARLGGKYSSSPLATGEHLIAGDREGVITVMKTGDQYDEIAQYDLKERIMASFVPVGDDLLIRTEKALYRFSTKAK